MSITDELREWAKMFWGCDGKSRYASNILAIADRIDAEYAALEMKYVNANRHGIMLERKLGGRMEAEMSITDELREWIADNYATDDIGILSRADLLDIAERIDAEHQKAMEDKVVGHAYIDVRPHIDWNAMADELDVFTQLVRGFAEQVGEDE